jgi:hypothetical protein
LTCRSLRLTDDNIAPFLVTDRPETFQLGRPAAEGAANFIVSPAHTAKPATPKQTPGYIGFIRMEKISTLPLNLAENRMLRPGRKHCAPDVFLTRTPHKESFE